MLPSQSFWDHFRVLHHGLHNVQAVETGAKHFFRYYPFLFPIGIFWVIFMVILWIMMKTHRKLLNLTTVSLVAQWISCPNLRKCLITFPRVSLVWNSLNRKVQYIQYMLFVNEFNKYIYCTRRLIWQYILQSKEAFTYVLFCYILWLIFLFCILRKWTTRTLEITW